MQGLRNILFGIAMAIAAPAVAQTPAEPQVLSSVLTIERERVFVETKYGQRLITEFNARAAEVQAENDRIVAELIAEESSLTEQRPSMTPEAFRAAADAFDTKAQDFRRSRDGAKDTLIKELSEREATFFARVNPIVVWLMQQRGATVVLDKGTVSFAADGIDITQDLIALIDRSLGDGTTVAPDE